VQAVLVSLVAAQLLALLPAEGAKNKTGLRSSDEAFAQHLKELEKKVPKGFSIVVQRPFVVIGDEPYRTVDEHTKRTVKWAVDMLKRDFFKKDPVRILDIWLFKDKSSYEQHAEAIFGEQPSTPFGYYSRAHGAIIMNIATGGGTLVHEIVHPFIEANFPDCPAWFNEGLASLYEQCGEDKAHIVGHTNWRLAGLQKAIESGTLPSFESLTATTSTEFYAKDRGTNYAQARYLCYYLQERNLLVKYYHAFSTGWRDDPTGYKTLQAVLGEEDMSVFEQTWRTFVANLTFP
jgi:hypothetical protein